ncbi:uncharacterized protein KY384_001764 [Bacidia gigantensis]|uniref:uncharacterized protein n=1 Tax=Bacidia gigantensis TaxID=2732470 RepID=UPI001D040F82|nr:uncharacterized protein KY384_001764 [Bacidia gigantensis]KAG8532982.1 hypothetical protein KY384_001764 [Bacidia gigantensis]
MRGDISSDAMLIDLDEGDNGYESDSTLVGDIRIEDDVMDLDPDDPEDPETGWLFIHHHSFRLPNCNIRVGKTVELKDGDFLRITSILQHRTSGEVQIRGLRLQRTNNIHSLLERNTNELAMILNYGPINLQSAESVRPGNVVKIRDVIFTNRVYPALSYRTIDVNNGSMNRQWHRENSRLVCRWKFLSMSKNSGMLQTMRKDECDDGFSVDDEQLRRTFRGSTIWGGSRRTWSRTEQRYDVEERQRVRFVDPVGFHSRSTTTAETIDLTTDTQPTDTQQKYEEPRYTYGDAFCCAGGSARGAKGAGLRVEWGFDIDPAAISSFHLNFSRAKCWVIAAHDFIVAITENVKVDILHLSPPCQPFSPAHTKAGKNDEMNQATFLAVQELLKRVRPRVVTLEETFGLSNWIQHEDWFKTIIRMFTNQGFSVRWSVFNLLDFGLAQPRKRLFIIASCRKPWTSINQIINRIPATNISLHKLSQIPRAHLPPYDGNKPLRKTICCGEGEGYHPSGKRRFTLREIASLQGFPLEHEFGKSISDRQIRKQIGNAVPPVVAKVFFEQIIKALKRADGIE